MKGRPARPDWTRRLRLVVASPSWKTNAGSFPEVTRTWESRRLGTETETLQGKLVLDLARSQVLSLDLTGTRELTADAATGRRDTTAITLDYG